MRLAVIGGSREADRLIEAAEKRDITIDPLADLVVIAAHPFDTDLIECSLLSAQHKRHILLQRPKWEATEKDNWIVAATACDAAEKLSALKTKRALLAVGNGRLAAFYRLDNIELFVRSRNAPHPPTPLLGEICPMRGPFNVKNEVKNMVENKIEALVVHNAGGQGGWPKMAAARELGLPVVLIDRPAPPNVKIVTSVEAALSWVAASLGLDLSRQST